MLKSQELQIKMSDVRNALNTSLTEETPDVEKRNENVQTLIKLESEYKAALALEATEMRQHEEGSETSISPYLRLKEKVSIGNYIDAALQMRQLDGAEAEFNKELGISQMGSNLPVELIAPAVEMRVDAVTSPGVVNRYPAGRFLDRVMAGTHATYLGISYDDVAVGQPIHTIMTGGTEAGMVAPGEQHDAIAATFTTATLTPKRLSARYVWRVEDVAKLAGLEAALQRDLSRVMAEHMDYSILMGDTDATGTAADIEGLTADTNVDTIDIDFYSGAAEPYGIEVEKVMRAFSAQVDGYYARTMQEMRILIAAHINSTALSSFTDKTVTTEFAIETLRRAGLTWQVHEKLGGAVAAGRLADNAVVGFASRPIHRTGVAVAAMWPTVSLIRDPYSGAGKGEIALTATGLWDFKVLRQKSFFKITLDNS